VESRIALDFLPGRNVFLPSMGETWKDINIVLLLGCSGRKWEEIFCHNEMYVH
jgi:hypothetical protein